MPTHRSTLNGPARTIVAATAALAVFATIAACGGPDDPGPTPTATTTIDPDRFEDYVALGDSFTAGPLIPKIRLDPVGCVRSTSDYPAYLAAYLDVRSYADVSCSGATTADLTRQQKTFAGTNQAQVEALSSDTDLVTVGIGGNDHSLFGDLIDVCAGLAADDPTGSPCRDRYLTDGVDSKLADAAAVQEPLTEVLELVGRRAPEAVVVVVGYPRLLPTDRTCPDVPFATGDYQWGDSVERALDTSLRRAAAAAGARYVDVYAASKGHDACAGDQAWVNGEQVRPLRAYRFHPFAEGMRAIASVVYGTLTGQHAPRRPPMESGAATLTRDAQRDIGRQIQRSGGPP